MVLEPLMSLTTSSSFPSTLKWYEGLTYREAMYLLYWHHYTQLEAILEAKGASSIDRATFLNGFKIWQFPRLMEKVLQWENKLVIPSNVVANATIDDPILLWCLGNKIPKGGRDQLLLRKMALLISTLEVPQETKKELFRKIVANCPNLQSDDKGWLRFFLKRKTRYTNNDRAEVNEWLRLHKLDQLCYRGIP